MEMNLSDDFIGALNEKFKKILKKYKRWIYDQNYYKKNKRKINDKNKKWNRNNKDKVKVSTKKFAENNKDKIRNYWKIYKQTEKGKKSYKINSWKSSGLICDDYDALYEKVINTTNCEECNVLLTVDRYCTLTTRCMDHDHVTGLFRNVLCNLCNLQRRY